jgi:hypothetical protein
MAYNLKNLTMKTIKIRKDNLFSANSKVFICSGTNKVHIKGYGLYALSLDAGDSIQASHLWTKSYPLKYEDLVDGSTVLIKPRFDRFFTIVVTVLFIAGICIFFLYKSRWSFIPLGIIAIYVAVYLTILKDRYLVIREERNGSK